MQFRKIEIGRQLILFSTLIFISVGIMIVVFINYSMRKHALNEAEDKALILLEQNLATHTYFSHQLRPTLFEITDESKPANYFEPIWMSSTYAVREIDKYFQSLSETRYYYKECAINSRSPENEANDYEKEFIKQLNANSELKKETGVREIGGAKVLYVLRRGEIMESECLRCHSTPDQAPSDMVKKYGSARSFNRSLGETISAISIQIPLTDAYKATNVVTLKISIVLIVAVLMILILKLMITRRLIIAPLEILKNKTLEIAIDKDKLGEQIHLSAGKELFELSNTFNLMSANLKSHKDHLEDDIKERTYDLSAANRKLTVELEAHIKTSKSLAREREKLSVTLRSIGEGVITTDMAGKITFINTIAEELTGWGLNEAIGKPIEKIFNIVNEKTGNKADNPVLQLLRSGFIDGVTNEALLISKAGIKKIIANSGAPILDSEGEIIGVVLVFSDITEKLKMESQIRKSKKMESIGTLTGGIAHDFNNILGIIIGNTELALDDVPHWNPLRVNLDAIKAAGIRAAAIVNQLLSFNRKTDQDLKPIKIIPIIKHSIKLLRSSIHANIEIITDIQETDKIVLASPAQIDQILNNLCINASQEMELTGGVLEITAKHVVFEENDISKPPDLSSGNYIAVGVKDSGTGIDSDIVDQVFDPYFTTKAVGKGSGLGLSVVHGLVQNHGGKVIVDSQPGEGTTFTLFFPVVTAASSELKPIVSDKPALGNEAILLVDDEKAIASVTEQMIDRMGYRVESKTDPVEALELFKTNPDGFDLVITDMTMPQMSGVQLSEELKRLRPDLPVIICTGHSSTADEVKSQELKIEAFIMKPTTRNELSTTIRAVLDKNKTKKS